jgi:putative PIN family toxin of toxin-antitoxin system
VPRAVLDPNVLVSALINPAGLPGRLWKEQRAGMFEMIVSVRLLAELESVLRRGKFHRSFTVDEAEWHLGRVRATAVVLADLETSNALRPSGPEDQYLINLLISSGADALVTGDRALLDLRDVVRVMSPAEFMATLGDS